ncbi:MAG TPA: efflux RND transporter periplasmic adaptor subunit [Chloroflexota bacterium]|nr:efflux RND transporter periplasmic adaptor subunit [Chloroflexota bacterium]
MTVRALSQLRPWQYAALAGVLAVMSVGGYFLFKQLVPEPAAAARPQTVEARQGAVSSTVTATGSVATPGEMKLSFGVSGVVAEVLVKVGDWVEVGQPLARLDPAPLQAALREAQASYRSMVAKLEQTRAGTAPDEIRAAESQVEQARLKLEQTRAAVNGPDLATAQSQIEQARAKLEALHNPRPEEVAAAQAGVEQARAKLEALLTPRPEEVAEAESQLAAAQAKLEALLTPRPEEVRKAELELETARAKLRALHTPRPEEIANAQAALDQAKAKLANLVDRPKTATPEELANAELAVKSAQIAYDKALADAAEADKPGSGLTRAASDAAIKQALIALEKAQNDLNKLKGQGPDEWEVRQAQLGVEQAQSNLDKLRNPAPADVQAAQAAVEQAQLALDKLRNPAPADVQAAQAGVVQAQTTLQKLKNPTPADVTGAEQGLAQAQLTLDKLLKPTEYDLLQAQEALKQAENSVQKQRQAAQYEVLQAQAALEQQQANLAAKRAGPTAADLAAAEAAVAQAAAAMQKAEIELAMATLTAPVAGTVSKLDMTSNAQASNAGSDGKAGTITLVDTSQLRVDVSVAEVDVAKVKVGQDVTLQLDALPDRTVRGKVSSIAPTGTTNSGVVTYTVQIAVEPDQATDLKPAMSATATIVTASKADALLVPNRAVRSLGQMRTVDVLGQDGQVSTRQVQVGLVGDQMTEITSGLQPGEQVVLPTPAGATSGEQRPNQVTFGAAVGPGPGAGPVMIRGGP